METYEGELKHWPVNWSAVWVGALAALAVGLLIGLVGFAVGAHEVSRFVDWQKVRLTSAAFSIGGAFFAFVVGGWAAGRIAGIRRSEPAMLQGSIVWVLTIPLLIGSSAVGATAYLGGWYGGLAGIPAWVTAVPPTDPNLAAGMRNTAVATVITLLLGLVGSVIGGWMASGEPMTLTYYRRRERARAVEERPRRIA
jgi:hypothetical protein